MAASDFEAAEVLHGYGQFPLGRRPTGWACFDAAERRAFVNHYFFMLFSKILPIYKAPLRENRGSL